MSLVEKVITALKRLMRYGGNFAVSAMADVSVFAVIVFSVKPILGVGIAIVMASVVARVLSSLINFKLNKELFIGDKMSHKKCLIRYYILWATLLTLSSSTIYRLHDIFAINEVLAKVIADLSLGVFSYQTQKRWVFNEASHAKTKGLYFRGVRKVAKLFLKREMMVDEEIFQKANILVGHHQNFYGPISCALWLPDTVSIWGIAHLFNFKDCFDMYYNYTFTQTIKMPKIMALPMATICGLMIPPLIKSAGLIPVYRESREIRTTFNRSMELLNKGEQVLIFPDVKYEDSSPVMGEMYDGFTHLERLYYRANNEYIGFVPILTDKEAGTIKNAKVLYLSHKESYKAGKTILAKQILDDINDKQEMLFKGIIEL